MNELEIIKIVSIALIGVILSGIIKGIKPDFAIYVVLTTVICIFLIILEKLGYMFSFLEKIYDELSYGKEFFPILIKVLAVSYLTDFVSDLCKDADEKAISSKVELAGKVIIFYLSIPILVSILDLINVIL